MLDRHGIEPAPSGVRKTAWKELLSQHWERPAANGLWMSQIGRNLTGAVDEILTGKRYPIHGRAPPLHCGFLEHACRSHRTKPGLGNRLIRPEAGHLENGRVAIQWFYALPLDGAAQESLGFGKLTYNSRQIPRQAMARFWRVSSLFLATTGENCPRLSWGKKKEKRPGGNQFPAHRNPMS